MRRLTIEFAMEDYDRWISKKEVTWDEKKKSQPKSAVILNKTKLIICHISCTPCCKCIRVMPELAGIIALQSIESRSKLPQSHLLVKVQ